MPRVQRGKDAAISMRWTRRVAAPCVCFVPWAALASCRPLPQQLLPVSAAGGGRRRCKQGAARPFQPQRGWLHTKKLAASLNDFFSFLRFEVAARRNVRPTACFNGRHECSRREPAPADAVCRYGPSREKAKRKIPQDFPLCKLKIIFPLIMARVQAEASLNC